MLQLRNAVRLGMYNSRLVSTSSAVDAPRKKTSAQKSVAKAKAASVAPKKPVAKVKAAAAAPKKSVVKAAPKKQVAEDAAVKDKVKEIVVGAQAVAKETRSIEKAYLDHYQTVFEAGRANRGPNPSTRATKSYRFSDRRSLDQYLSKMSQKKANEHLIGNSSLTSVKKFVDEKYALGPRLTLDPVLASNKKLCPTFLPPATPFALFYTLERAQQLIPLLKASEKLTKLAELQPGQRSKLANMAAELFESPSDRQMKLAVLAAEAAYEQLSSKHDNEIAEFQRKADIAELTKPKRPIFMWSDAKNIVSTVKKPGMRGPEIMAALRELWAKQPATVVAYYEKAYLNELQKYEKAVSTITSKAELSMDKPLKKKTLFAIFCDEQNSKSNASFKNNAQRKAALADELKKNRRNFDKLNADQLSRLETARVREYENRLSSRRSAQSLQANRRWRTDE